MKKIMSLILAVLCVTLAALPLSVSAEENDLKLSDYVSSYTSASNATSWGSKDTVEFVNDGTQLDMKQSVGQNAGFSADLSKLGVVANSNESYTIRFTLKSKVTEEMSPAHAGSVTNASQIRYMYMAFPNSALGATGGTALDGGNNTCPRLQWASSQVSVTMPGSQNNTYIGNASGISASLRNATETTFTLTVQNGKWTSIMVSDGTNILKTVFDTDVPATSTNFAFCYRCDWQNVKPLYATEAVLTSFTVTKGTDGVAVGDASIVGGQLNEDNTKVRILAKLTMPESELANFKAYGFEVALKDSDKAATTLTSSKVYTSVTAEGEPVLASDKNADYLGAMTITGIEQGAEAKTYTFVVSAFVIDSADVKWQCAAKEISITVPAITPES